MSRISRFLYSGTRRLALLDVTVLMHGFRRDLVSTGIPQGYRPVFVTPQELSVLKQKGSVDSRIGDFDTTKESPRTLATLFEGERLVCFAWFAASRLPACETSVEPVTWEPPSDCPLTLAFFTTFGQTPETEAAVSPAVCCIGQSNRNIATSTIAKVAANGWPAWSIGRIHLRVMHFSVWECVPSDPSRVSDVALSS